MATSNPSIDSLSSNERLIVRRALSLLIASMQRAAKASHSPAIAAVYESDLQIVEALELRFR